MILNFSQIHFFIWLPSPLGHTFKLLLFLQFPFIQIASLCHFYSFKLLLSLPFPLGSHIRNFSLCHSNTFKFLLFCYLHTFKLSYCLSYLVAVVQPVVSVLSLPFPLGSHIRNFSLCHSNTFKFLLFCHLHTFKLSYCLSYLVAVVQPVVSASLFAISIYLNCSLMPFPNTQISSLFTIFHFATHSSCRSF